jgi:hypothetical protein
MKAILTRYIPATNTKPSRIIASAEGVKPLAIGYHSVDSDPHSHAARALAMRQGWTGALIGGGLPNGDQCWVFAQSNMLA